jgi:hypothetical protein
MHARMPAWSATRRRSFWDGFARERLQGARGTTLTMGLVLVLLYCCETDSRLLPFFCRQVLPGLCGARPAGCRSKGAFRQINTGPFKGPFDIGV